MKLIYFSIGLTFLAINIVAGFAFVHCSTVYRNFNVFNHYYYGHDPTPDWPADPEFAKNLTYDNIVAIAQFLKMHYENDLGYSNVTAQVDFRIFTYLGEIVPEYWIKLEQVRPVQVVEMDKIPLACVWSITVVSALTLALEWAKESGEHEARKLPKPERKREESSS